MNSDKYILVCGAGGFIGGHLVTTLVNDGFIVYGVDLKYPEFKKSDAQKFIIADLTRLDAVEEVFKAAPKGFDQVYQLAADMGGATYINSGEHDADVMSNSVTINVNVARCCVKYKANRLFFPSSACVYPQTSKDSSTCREDEVYPARPENEYGWEKLFTERMLKSYQRQHGLSVRIARFHSIVGEHAAWRGGKEKAHSALARKVAMAVGQTSGLGNTKIDVEGDTIDVIGDGKQLRTFLHVSDCIAGIRKLMASDCEEIMNIGSDETITIIDYVGLLKKISGKALNVRFIPGPTGVKERRCDSTKARRLLNWNPLVSLEDATRSTYNWIVEQLDLRPAILFISQPMGFAIEEPYHCGAGIRGKLVCDLIKKSDKYKFVPCFIDNIPALEKLTAQHKPKVIIYNYHAFGTSWMHDGTFRYAHKDITHIMIHYDFHQHKINTFTPAQYHGFNYVLIDDDTLVPSSNVFIIPRALPAAELFKYKPFPVHADTKSVDAKEVIPKIGFQGFAVPHKGIHRIAAQIQKEFDEAIFRLHIPVSYFGDRSGNTARQILDQVRSIITKPGIKIEVSHNFMTDEEIVKWLNENTVNCYFNDYLDGAGIATSPDYALSARKPIAVTRSHQFRHMWNLKPTILIENTTLKAIIANGIAPLKPLYDRYTNEALVHGYEAVCDKFVTEKQPTSK